MPLTDKQFRALKWREAYRDGDYAVFHSEGLDGFTLVHAKQGTRTINRYRVKGRWYDSPTEAIRAYNGEKRHPL